MAPEPESTAKRVELPMHLTRLRVKNFRSIADIDIPLSPLTVLVGPNGSGKSNVVDALRFVRDVFARGLDQAVMDREGMGVIQRWGTKGEGITIGVTFRVSPKDVFVMKQDGSGVTPATESAGQLEYDFTITETSAGNALVEHQSLVLLDESDNNSKLSIIRKGENVSSKLGNKDWVDGLEVQNFLPLHVLYPEGDIKTNELLSLTRSLFIEKGDGPFSLFALPHANSNPTIRKEVRWWNKFEEVAKAFNECINNSSFYTLNPADLRQPQQVVKASPFDEKGRNMAAVLRNLIRDDDESSWPSMRFALRQAVAGFKNIEVESVGGYLATKLIYKIDAGPSRSSYLGQESDGTIRMLGLLAALYQEPSQPFISVEEPEANIHPGALAILAGVIDEASLRSQVLVTTHSPDMLDHLPVESFIVVEKLGDTTQVGPLDASQIVSVRKRLFTPGELFRMEGLQRQTEQAS